MKDDAKVERNKRPDTEHQTALEIAEDFLRKTPYLTVSLSEDYIIRKFGENWKDVLKIIEEQGVCVSTCYVYKYQKYKWSLIDVLEEKPGYKFQPKLDAEGEIANPILRERYKAARVIANEFAARVRMARRNIPESKMPHILGKDWRIVLRILHEERNFKIETKRVWRRYGFLKLKKEHLEWRYVITSPVDENAD